MRYASRRAVALFAALVPGTLTGCSRLQPQPVLAASSTAYARFQPTSQIFGTALDTKTGQLCRTFNAKLPTDADPALASLPLCVQLSQNEDATVKEVIKKQVAPVQHKVGDAVMLNGQRVVIKSINEADGTFTY
jgi:hypothetical protein